MDLLNDDCVEEVCERLLLQEQINMALASNDFRNALLPLWQRSYEVLDLDVIQKNSNFEFFIKSVQGSVKKLIFNVKTTGLQRILSEMKFTNLETIDMSKVVAKANECNDLLLLIEKGCPYLKELRMSGEISGKHICQLQKLERIDLNCDPGALDHVHTEELFKSLKLKKVALIKGVHWEDWEYMGIATDELVQDVLLCETLEELYFDTDFLQERFLNLFVLRLKNLRKLSFFDLFRFKLGQINGIICEAVKGLILTGRFYGDNREIDGLLSLLSRSQNIELLCISNCAIDLNFLREIIQTVMDRKSFVVHCYKTKITANDLRLISNTLPDGISISLDDYKNDTFNSGDVQLLLKI